MLHVLKRFYMGTAGIVINRHFDNFYGLLFGAVNLSLEFHCGHKRCVSIPHVFESFLQEVQNLHTRLKLEFLITFGRVIRVGRFLDFQ